MLTRYACERCAHCGRGLNWIEIAFGTIADPTCGRCLINRRTNAMTWTKQRQGPDESRFIIGPEPESRFIARMDNEATDAEWQLATAAPAMLQLLDSLYHQLATDSDLDNVTAARAYAMLTDDIARVIAQADPGNPQIQQRLQRGDFDDPQITAIHWTSTDAAYRLDFPLSQLGNALALCGWTLQNAITKTPEVNAELARLGALDSLPIPDGREWFAKYGTKYTPRED